MRIIKAILISLCVVSSTMFAAEFNEDLSLEKIVSLVNEDGIEKGLKRIEKSKDFEKQSRKITLSNAVEILSANRFEKIKWTASKLS
jgi:hypothetical protein